MSAPTRFPNGVTNVGPTKPLAQCPLPDMTSMHYYMEDFDYYVAADWTVTVVGTGTQALTNANGGVLLLTNSAADNDSIELQKVGEGFLPTSLKKLFYKVRFSVSDATQIDWIVGLAVTDTSPLAAGGDGVTDGIFFQKDDGDTQIDFYVQKNATTGQLTTTNLATAGAANAMMELSFYFDGSRYVQVFMNDALVYTADLTTTLTTYLPDTTLTPILFVQNGEAVAKTMSVDYVLVAQER